MIKAGKRIWVRASRSLGSPRVRATVMSVRYRPGEIPQYPNGLLAVCPDNSPEDREFYAKHPDGEATTVDFNGTVYSGPPLDGYLVEFP